MLPVSRVGRISTAALLQSLQYGGQLKPVTANPLATDQKDFAWKPLRSSPGRSSRSAQSPTTSHAVLVDGEEAVAAYNTFRDSAIFTTHRLIVRDAQRLRGKKVEVYSLPYSAINMWSSEDAGGFLDMNAELELWTRAGPHQSKPAKRHRHPQARPPHRSCGTRQAALTLAKRSVVMPASAASVVRVR